MGDRPLVGRQSGGSQEKCGRGPVAHTPRKIRVQVREYKHTSLIYLVGKFCELRQVFIDTGKGNGR